MVKKPMGSELNDNDRKLKMLPRRLQICISFYGTIIGSRVMRSSLIVTSKGHFFSSDKVQKNDFRSLKFSTKKRCEIALLNPMKKN